MSMCLTGQSMPSISVFKRADTNAGAIQTVIVEIKYISSNNVAIHTENCKLEISLDCTLKEFQKTIRQKKKPENRGRTCPLFACLFVSEFLFLFCLFRCLLCFVFVCLFLFCFVFHFFGFPFLLFPPKSFSYTESILFCFFF